MSEDGLIVFIGLVTSLVVGASFIKLVNRLFLVIVLLIMGLLVNDDIIVVVIVNVNMAVVIVNSINISVTNANVDINNGHCYLLSDNRID